MTLDEVKDALDARGMTLTGWAVKNGFHVQTVITVILMNKPSPRYPIRAQILNALDKTLKSPIGAEKMPHESGRVE